LPGLRCHGQGSPLAVIPAVNICPTTDEQLRDVKVPFGGYFKQSSPAIFFLCVHIGAAVSQEPCEVKVSHTVTRDAEESNFVPCARSHQNRSSLIAVRGQNVHIVTQRVME